MPIDFDHLARKTKEADEREAAEKAARSKEEKDARNALIDKAIGHLETYITPRLDEAKKSLLKSGIDCVIEKKYDVRNRLSVVWPLIIFKCAAPPRQSDSYVAFADEIHFTATTNAITATFSGSLSGSTPTGKGDLGTSAPDSSDDLVAKAFEHAVSTYHKMIRNLPYKI